MGRLVLVGYQIRFIKLGRTAPRIYHDLLRDILINVDESIFEVEL